LLSKVLLAGLVHPHRGRSEHKHWLVNSFPEVDVEVPSLPASAQFVGPVASPLGQAPKVEGEFAAFCDQAEKAGLPVICVSLGSMTVPDKVVANAIYSGLKGGPWRVIWSCKEWAQSQLPEVDTTQFLLSPWIPQNAMLADPRCKAFLAHGGWGGTMEAAMSGMPVLALPFFGDQPTSAQLIESSGWGLSLPCQNALPSKSGSTPPTYKGKLTAEEVRAKMTRFVTEPSFAEKARTIQAAALRMGGASAVAEVIELHAKRSVSGEDRRTGKSEPRVGCGAGLVAKICG